MDINQLQPFQRTSLVYQALFDAENGQLDLRDASITDFSAQMLVDTATWALTIYEKELGIVVISTQTYSDRRSVIKAKMRGVGMVNEALIKLVASSYTNGTVEVGFDGTIVITFVDLDGDPPNLDDLKAAIEEIRPAHLPVGYLFVNRIYGTIYVGVLVTEADVITITLKTKIWSAESGTWNDISDGKTWITL